MTKNPRVSFAISPEQLAEITAFQKEHRYKSLSQAVLTLLRMGIEAMRPMEEAQSVSAAAKEMASEFDRLDSFGQTAVRRTVNTELERVKAQQGQGVTSAPLAARGYTGGSLDTNGVRPFLAEEAKRSSIDL